LGSTGLFRTGLAESGAGKRGGKAEQQRCHPTRPGLRHPLHHPFCHTRPYRLRRHFESSGCTNKKVAAPIEIEAAALEGASFVSRCCA
jgi:hypothetical protein